MDNSEREILSWIETQRDCMVRRVTDWASVNSYSLNVEGVEKLGEMVAGQFSGVKGDVRRHEVLAAERIDARGEMIRLPLGRAIEISKRPKAPVQVLLNIHLDTVYPPEGAFQTVWQEGGMLRGPGVADAKGGLAVMLTALEGFERCANSGRIGWRVVLNSDEEIGSPGSGGLLAKVAKECQFGLLFEPALPDGALVDRRRGSGNFNIIVRGRAAHVGRDFAAGRSALLAAARISLGLHELNQTLKGVTVNVGAINGGGPVNVVPELAICRVNIRTSELGDEERAIQAVRKIVGELNFEGITAEVQGQFMSPPKIPDDRTLRLLEAIVGCGRELGLKLGVRGSGGSSDGNRLAAAGLANIDTLGVRGDRIHSPEEYMVMDSLVERAQLTALLLVKIAAGDIDIGAFSR